MPALLLVLALVLGLGGVAANSVAQHRELDQLLARVLAAQGAIAYSNHRVAATVDYTRPLLFSASVPEHVRSGLQKLIEDAAATQVDGVAVERDRAGGVLVLPWHRALRRAQADLVDYLDARVAYLRAVAADQHVLYVAHPDLDRLLDRARKAFRDAAGVTARRRVDAAFAGGTHPA